MFKVNNKDNHISDVALVSFMLPLNVFHTYFLHISPNLSGISIVYLEQVNVYLVKACARFHKTKSKIYQATDNHSFV